jgi:hypothetical protein
MATDERTTRALDDLRDKPHLKGVLTGHPRRFMRRYELSPEQMVTVSMVQQMLKADFNDHIGIDERIFDK